MWLRKAEKHLIDDKAEAANRREGKTRGGKEKGEGEKKKEVKEVAGQKSTGR